MNPFILNLEAVKPETNLVQPSSRIFENERILENENAQESEFAKMLKSQIIEESAHVEETVEKDDQRNFLLEKPAQSEEFLENADDNRLYERLAIFFHEAESKPLKTEKKQAAEIYKTEMIEPSKGPKSETNRLTENETAVKIKTNTEGRKTATDHVKKAIGESVRENFAELSRQEKRLNESDKAVETGVMSKETKNIALRKIPETFKKDLDGLEKESSAKFEKEIKQVTEKPKNLNINASIGEKAKSAVAAAKAVQENNEQPISKITIDTANIPKTEIFAETKGGHNFQFSRDGQLPQNETANKFSPEPQARPAYNFQEQLQSLLDNAKVYVKDGKNGAFHVNLYPKSLGSVGVNLGLEHGILNGRFLVENADAKEALLQNFDNIKQQLEESGITVGEFHVNVRGEREKHSGELQKEVVNYRGSFSENEEITAVYEMNTTSYHKGSINMVI